MSVLILFLLLPLGDVPGDIEAEVTRVWDGDTVHVRYAGEIHSVRYIGVDTPEVYFGVQCYGREASQANKDLVQGQTVRLVRDVRQYDDNERLLRYVYLLDGTFVNAELVEGGYARAREYPPDTAQAELFASLELQARADRRGMWAVCWQWVSLPRLGR